MPSTRGGFGGIAIGFVLAVLAFAVLLALSAAAPAAAGSPGGSAPTGARPPMLTGDQIPSQYRLHLGGTVAFTALGSITETSSTAAGPGPEPTDAPFSGNVAVTSDPSAENRPSEARDSQGRTYIAFQREVTGTNHDIYVSWSDDDGRTWSAAVAAAATSADETSPSIIVTSGDRVTIFFQQNANLAAFAYAQSTNRGGSWTTVAIGGGGLPVQNYQFPSFVANGGGAVGMYGIFCTDATNCLGGAWSVLMLFTTDISNTGGWTGTYFAQPPDVELFHPSAGVNPATGDLVGAIEIEIFNNAAWDLTWFRFNPTNGFRQDGLMCGNFCPSNSYVWPSMAVDGARAITGAHFFNTTLAPFNEVLAVYATNLLASPTPLPGGTWQLVNTMTGRIDGTAQDKKYVSFDLKGPQIQAAYWKNGATWFVNGINAGATFQSPARVSDNTPATAIDQIHAVVVRNTTAGPLIAWHDSRDGNANIYFAGFQRYTIGILSSPATRAVRFDNDAYAAAPISKQFPAGTQHTIQAQSPQPPSATGTRYVFTQWADGSTANPRTITVTANANYTANFVTQYEITVVTDPVGRTITVDNAPHTGPYAFWCNASAQASLGAPSPQTVDATSQYRFDSWSDALAQTHAITCNTAKTATATFVLQFKLTVATNPSGREVVVAGTPQTGPSVTWCDSSSSVLISATTPQPLSPTSQYRWDAWSDSGARSHTIACTGPMTLTATFVLQYQITIRTSPVGREVIVDGNSQTGPYVNFWDVGANIGLQVPSPQPPGAPLTRYVFSVWSDANPNNPRTLVADTSKEVTAQFTTEYYLSMTSNNVGPATLNPGSGYRTAGEVVPISTGNSPGIPNQERYVFGGWSGDVVTPSASTTVTMDGPRSVRANWVHQFKVGFEFATGVPGPSITVDSVAMPAPASVWWDESSVHTVAVPANFESSSDTRYNFLRWQGAGTTPDFAVTVTGSATYTATYTRQYRVTFTISPTGPTVMVDGVAWSPAQELWFDENTPHVFDAGANPQPGATGERFKFSAWSGGGTGTQSTLQLTVDSGKVLTATYTRQFLLTIDSAYGNPTCVNPAGTASSGCWWNEGTTAQVTLTTPFQVGGTKHAFTGWSEGTVSGSTVSVQMDRAKTITASWRDIAFVEEYGVALGGLIAIIVAIIGILLFVVMRRRRQGPQAVPPPPMAQMAPAMAQAPMAPPPPTGQAAVGTKTCGSCGMEIPGAASTCPVCGSPV